MKFYNKFFHFSRLPYSVVELFYAVLGATFDSDSVRSGSEKAASSERAEKAKAKEELRMSHKADQNIDNTLRMSQKRRTNK